MSSQEWLLVFCAFFTSTLSGIIGLGGGMLLLTLMAQYFPPLILIPLHGIAQLGSNASRAWLHRRDILWPLVWQCSAGSLIGAAVGSLFVVEVPEKWLRIGLGIFILGVTLLPLRFTTIKSRLKWFLLGVVTAFLSLFIGATGPLISPFYVQEGFKKGQILGTESSNQTFMHGFKVLSFVGLGFAIQKYALFIVLILVSVTGGSWFGKQLVGKISETLFKKLYIALIVFLALRMIWIAI